MIDFFTKKVRIIISNPNKSFPVKTINNRPKQIIEFIIFKGENDISSGFCIVKNEKSEITGEEKRKLDTILDIPVTISMEVGRSKINIRNLLQLNQGSVVELDRAAGEPLDVLVNGTLIAHGEVVVVNDKFGIRLTDVISQVERIKKLR